MPSPKPEITIGILCYNAELTIQRAIKSALEQDHHDFEVIVVDDASTDKSTQKIRPFLKDPRLKLICHKTNKGQGLARNSVIKSSRGTFVVFFDDDDVSKPNRLTVQLNTIVNHEVRFKTEKILCFASGRRIYPNGYIVKTQAIGSNGDTPPSGAGMAKYLLAFERQKQWFYGSGTPTSGLMIRRRLLLDIGGFDVTLRRVEDIDLAIRLALIGAYFVGCKEPLVDRYMTTSTYKLPAQNLLAEQRLVKKYRDFLSAEGLFYHAYNWPLLRYHHFNKQYAKFIITLAGLFLHNPIKTMVHLFATGPKRILHELQMEA